MGTTIYRLADDCYVQWSTVVDAPISSTFTRQQAINAGVDADRLDRADINNHSYLDQGHRTIQALIACNRAGPNETKIGVKAIIARYRPVLGIVSVGADTHPASLTWKRVAVALFAEMADDMGCDPLSPAVRAYNHARNGRYTEADEALR